MLQRLAYQALELADIGLDRALARRGTGVALTFLRLDPELVVGLLLEGLERAGQRADLVAALGIAGIDGKIAAGDLQHGVAHIVERRDDASGHRHHGAHGQRDRNRQQSELHGKRALRRGALYRGMFLGGVKGGFGDADGGGEASDRDRGPLVRGQLRFLAAGHGVEQAIAQVLILRLEIRGLGRGHGGGKRRRQLHSPGRQFQGFPCDIDAAEQPGIGLAGFRRHLAGGEPGRNQQRCLARGIAQEPGDLLDRQQLVDRRILMVDRGGQDSGQLVERVEQALGRFHVFLRQRLPARSLRLAHFLPEFLLLGGELLEQAVEISGTSVCCCGNSIIGSSSSARPMAGISASRMPRRYLSMLAVDRRFRVQDPVGAGPIRAQIVHRLEQIRRGIGDQRDAARHLQPTPGFPGVERKSDHHAKRRGQDHGFQKCGYGQTVQHGCPQKPRRSFRRRMVNIQGGFRP